MKLKIYKYIGGTLNAIIEDIELFESYKGNFFIKNKIYMLRHVESLNSFNFDGFYSLKKLNDREKKILREKYIWF